MTGETIKASSLSIWQDMLMQFIIDFMYAVAVNVHLTAHTNTCLSEKSIND